MNQTNTYFRTRWSFKTNISRLSMSNATNIHLKIELHIQIEKDERYGGVVLGKDRFSKDVSLCYHGISIQIISYMSTVHAYLNQF